MNSLVNSLFIQVPAVRRPAVAGSFYPADATTLERDIDEFLEQTGERPLAPGFPKLIIVPHAGYMYSGAVAASAYTLLRPARGIVRRVVLLGPCHRVPVRGLALPAASAFESPLGRVPIDSQAVSAARGFAQVVESAATHAQEHALEVQLPFLQQVLGDFSLVPFVVGDAAPEKVAEVLESLWGGPETLIVISSDLSHYHPYEAAREIDAATVKSIVEFDPSLSHAQACGATPVAGALIAARRRGLKPQLLDCRNSGDTAGGKSEVVGYASFAFFDEQARYEREHGAKLLELARASIARALGSDARKPVSDEAWLSEWRATFVTLKQGGDLRGCVGAIQAHRLLAEDVIANARAAAFDDPRFEPMQRDELARTDIEVSLLSTPRRLLFEDHDGLVAQLRPGVDGLILEHGSGAAAQRATFLPQVWEALPDAEQFLAQLKRKAGFPPDERTTRFRIKCYTVMKWREAELSE